MDIVNRGRTTILKRWRHLFICGIIIVVIPILLLQVLPKARADSSGIWQQYTYNGPAGSRPYFVYTPASYQVGTAIPLIVMLRACTQTPADFAAGTQMDQLADQKQFIAVYPQQTSTYNQEKSWNWFDSADQSRQGQAAYNAMGSAARVVPTITFHGTSDYLVYPINGEQVVRQWMQTDHLASHNAYNASFNSPTSTTNGQVAGGHSYSVYTWNDNNGNEVQEYWLVNGMGHGWSGGSSSGTYTDPQGPGATQAIYNFFMSHPA